MRRPSLARSWVKLVPVPTLAADEGTRARRCRCLAHQRRMDCQWPKSRSRCRTAQVQGAGALCLHQEVVWASLCATVSSFRFVYVSVALSLK
ncbi:hypothetical protein BCR44DRAFT_1425260 [Catenaria anguillulae PL171]|uniref:Uncharacterized protein n=1 Tax=Catenaria anguillulae PL171 TaxID=765915 RepID=A0A1Y2I0Z2_9FUNG|nr:hypothetical protein BCR44DRAFT_1425260 [Catenaria anguillulae PL171]